MSKRNAMIALKGSDLSLPGAFIVADLSCSSKYSSENLEGHSRDGFHVNIN